MQEFLRKYLVPVYQAADPPGDAPPDPVLSADPPPADPPVADDPPADPEPAPPKHGLPPSVISQLTDLRGKAREAEERAQRAEREAAEARQLAERLSRGDKGAPPAPTPAPRQPASGDDEVNRRAAEMVFAQNAQTVSENGVKKFGQGWVDAVNALNAYGVNSVDFVSSVMEIDREHTHEIMHAIAQDGEKAMQLAAMSPARRIAEITRISMNMGATAPKADPKTETPPAPKAPVAPKQVSKAPAPPPPVEPSGTKVVDWRSDDASEEEFDAGFWKNQEERAKRRGGVRR